MLSWAAVIISLLGFVPYIASILRKETEPHLVTWLIWTIVGAILVVSYYYSSHPTFLELLVPIAYVIGPLAITCLALFYGNIEYSKFNIGCFIAAILSLMLWYVLDNPFIVLLLNILLDFFGTLPTIHKTYIKPESENLLAWSLFLIGNFINLLALNEWNVMLVSYPLYLFTISLIITALILRSKFLNNKF